MLFSTLFSTAFARKTTKRCGQRGKLKYAVFVAKGIPFFILDFPNDNFNTDASINVYKIDDEAVDDWLNSDGNVITMFLVDARTNVIHGMRMISIVQSLAEQIRNACEKQDEVYGSAEEVDKVVYSIMSRYSTNEMLAATKSFNEN